MGVVRTDEPGPPAPAAAARGRRGRRRGRRRRRRPRRPATAPPTSSASGCCRSPRRWPASGEVRRALRARTTRPQRPAAARRARSAAHAGVGFVVFMSPDGHALLAPDPGADRRPLRRDDRPGAGGPRVHGDDDRDARARRCAPWCRSATAARVVGLVAVGVLQEEIADQVRAPAARPARRSLARRARWSAARCRCSLARRVRRQTRGLDPHELAALYEHHDAVLHAIREGVVVVGEDGRLLLANDEARRLLGLAADAVGRPIGELRRRRRAARRAARREAARARGCTSSATRVLVTGHRARRARRPRGGRP